MLSYLCACVNTIMGVYMHDVHVCVHVGSPVYGGQRLASAGVGYLLHHSPPYILRKRPSLDQFIDPASVVVSGDPSILTFPLLRLKVCTAIPRFYVYTEDQTQGPHPWETSTLPTEPFSQPP